MTSKFVMSFIDASGETSTVSVNMVDITAANFDTVLDGPSDLPAALQLAIAGCSMCNDYKSQVQLKPVLSSAALPNDQNAQRENALLVTMEDTVTLKKFTLSIPGPDRTLMGIAGSDMVNPASAQWVALVAALENSARSDIGNTINVVGGRFVSRRG